MGKWLVWKGNGITGPRNYYRPMKFFNNWIRDMTKGTIALRIDLPENQQNLSLRVPNSSAATKLFTQDQMILEIGVVSSQIQNYVPNSSLAIVDVPGDIELLVMQVANFHYPYTGTWDSILIGQRDYIHKKRIRDIILTSIISGALLFMGIYHLCLYLLRRKDKSPLWFALICILMTLRTLSIGERILVDMFSPTWLSWRILVGIEHISIYMILPLFFLYFKEIFPWRIDKFVMRIILISSGLWTGLLIFTPVLFNLRFEAFYDVLILLGGGYLLIKIFGSMLRKEQGAFITILGFSLLVLTSINDVLLSNGIIKSVYLASIGVFLYTFSQSFLLSQRFSSLFNTVARYSNDLELLNHSLERFIPHEVLQYLDKESIVDVELGDFIEAEMTVFFLDIRNFTNFSESISSRDTFRFINSFLNRIGPVIRLCGGFVDKYLGDGVMALFPGSPDDALKAALNIRKGLELFNLEREERNLQVIGIGIGINTGNLMLGTIGENMRMDSTVISDTVNTASRMETLTKELKCDILISQATVDTLVDKKRFSIELVGEFKVKGKSKTVKAHRVNWGKTTDEIDNLKTQAAELNEELE
jgi:adenylate cyclase